MATRYRRRFSSRRRTPKYGVLRHEKFISNATVSGTQFNMSLWDAGELSSSANSQRQGKGLIIRVIIELEFPPAAFALNQIHEIEWLLAMMHVSESDVAVGFDGSMSQEQVVAVGSGVTHVIADADAELYRVRRSIPMRHKVTNNSVMRLSILQTDVANAQGCLLWGHARVWYRDYS